MKVIYIVLAVSALAIISGCGDSSSDDGRFGAPGQEPCLYVADRVHVIGLTAIEPDPGDRSSSVVSVYLSLLDQFDSSIKMPAVFRFELYEYVPRSSERRGRRIHAWKEIDLTDAAINNDYWKDFLRAYEFSLEVGINSGLSKTYILQVTCATATNKRLTDIFYLNETKK